MSGLVRFMVIACLYLRATSTGAVSPKDELEQIINDFWRWRLEEWPQFGTYLGKNQHVDRLRSLSEAAFERRKAKVDSYIDDLNKIDVNSLDKSNMMDYKVLVGFLQAYSDGYKFKEYTYNAINFLEGVHFRHLYVSRMKTIEDYQSLLMRMSSLVAVIKETQVLLQKAIDVNKTMHRVSIERVPDQIAEVINVNPIDYYLYAPFNITLENIAAINKTLRDDLRLSAISLINEIFNEFRAISRFIKEIYIPNSRTEYGVSSWQGGREFYKAALRWHLTVDLTPEAVHQIGLDEVDRISKEMNKVKESVNFTGSIKNFIKNLRQQPQFFLKSSEAMLQRYRDIINLIIRPSLPKIFSDLPNFPLIVEAAADRSAIIGVYWFVSPDGSKPGRFVANVFEPSKSATFDMLALTLHETEPGHHLQISKLYEAELSDFRKYFHVQDYYSVPFQFPFCTSHLEGWALYAEYLGEELGLYHDPYDLFGRYASEMFRACRLVVDTGIHYKGWSRQKAIDYMADRITDPQSVIESEIDRYITWPGQACAYKIGEIEIKKMRRESSISLGSKFDVKEFHFFFYFYR